MAQEASPRDHCSTLDARQEPWRTPTCGPLCSRDRVLVISGAKRPAEWRVYHDLAHHQAAASKAYRAMRERLTQEAREARVRAEYAEYLAGRDRERMQLMATALMIVGSRLPRRTINTHHVDVDDVIVNGCLRIDGPTRTASAGGEAIPLTPVEWDIIAYLTSRLGRVCEYGEIFDAIWPERRSRSERGTLVSGYSGDTRQNCDATLRTHIGRLRVKLRRYDADYIDRPRIRALRMRRVEES